MTQLQLLFLVSCISQGMRYSDQLLNLIESLAYPIVTSVWSKLVYANMCYVCPPQSNKRPYFCESNKMIVLMPLRYLMPCSQTQCQGLRRSKWKKNSVLNFW